MDEKKTNICVLIPEGNLSIKLKSIKKAIRDKKNVLRELERIRRCVEIAKKKDGFPLDRIRRSPYQLIYDYYFDDECNPNRTEPNNKDMEEFINYGGKLSWKKFKANLDKKSEKDFFSFE